MGCAAGVRGCHLTIRSSRDRFAASAWRRRLRHRRGRKSVRLNSGVRPLSTGLQAKSFQVAVQAHFSSAATPTRASTKRFPRSSWPQFLGSSNPLPLHCGRSWSHAGMIDTTLRPVVASSGQKSIAEQRPNNSFKPRPLRGLGKVP